MDNVATSSRLRGFKLFGRSTTNLALSTAKNDEPLERPPTPPAKDIRPSMLKPNSIAMMASSSTPSLSLSSYGYIGKFNADEDEDEEREMEPLQERRRNEYSQFGEMPTIARSKSPALSSSIPSSSPGPSTVSTNASGGPPSVSSASSRTAKSFFAKLGSLTKKRSNSQALSTLSLIDDNTSIALTENPDNDDKISIPWNFQHHIHVDETFGGLPPSWASALAERGYTPEEIEVIQTQRLKANRQLYQFTPSEPGLGAASHVSRIMSSSTFGGAVNSSATHGLTNGHSQSPPSSSGSPPPSTLSQTSGRSRSRRPPVPSVLMNAAHPDVLRVAGQIQSVHSPSLGSPQNTLAGRRGATQLRVMNASPYSSDEEEGDATLGPGDVNKILSPPPTYGYATGENSGMDRAWRNEKSSTGPGPSQSTQANGDTTQVSLNGQMRTLPLPSESVRSSNVTLRDVPNHTPTPEDDPPPFSESPLPLSPPVTRTPIDEGQILDLRPQEPDGEGDDDASDSPIYTSPMGLDTFSASGHGHSRTESFSHSHSPSLSQSAPSHSDETPDTTINSLTRPPVPRRKPPPPPPPEEETSPTAEPVFVPQHRREETVSSTGSQPHPYAAGYADLMENEPEAAAAEAKEEESSELAYDSLSGAEDDDDDEVEEEEVEEAEESIQIEKIPALPPRISLFTDGDSLGSFDLGFDFLGSSQREEAPPLPPIPTELATTSDAKGNRTSSASRHSSTASRRRTHGKSTSKSRIRVKELGLELNLQPRSLPAEVPPAPPPTRESLAQGAQASEQSGSRPISSSLSIPSVAPSTRARTSVATASTGDDSSPLWHALMEMVNPPPLPTPPIQIEDADADADEPVEQPAKATAPLALRSKPNSATNSPLPSPALVVTSDARSQSKLGAFPQRTSSLLLSPLLSSDAPSPTSETFTAQESRTSAQTTPSAPLLSPVLPASFAASQRRMSALKTPPPFPPPNYPPPSPASSIHGILQQQQQQQPDGGRTSPLPRVTSPINIAVARRLSGLSAVSLPPQRPPPSMAASKILPPIPSPTVGSGATTPALPTSSTSARFPLSSENRMAKSSTTSNNTSEGELEFNSIRGANVALADIVDLRDGSWGRHSYAPPLPSLQVQSADLLNTSALNTSTSSLGLNSREWPVPPMASSSDELANRPPPSESGDDHASDLLSPSIAHSDLRSDYSGVSPSVLSIPSPPYENIPSVVRPLAPFIRANVDPRKLFKDLYPIAEGQYGAVYSGRFVDPSSLDHNGEGSLGAVVAIKLIPLGSTSCTPRLKGLHRELNIMGTIRHEHILSMEDLYLDIVEKSRKLWIQMDLMQRSLADILELYDELGGVGGNGGVVTESIIARFAKDSLSAIAHLQLLGIAHRDVRSDNMLLDAKGILKLADFAHAVQVPVQKPTFCTDAVGVVHWQAPEVRQGPYNPLQIDVWGIGATVWELIEGVPPFVNLADGKPVPTRWESFSSHRPTRLLEEFLKLCSEPVATRPVAEKLLSNPFIKTASPHTEVIALLDKCQELEG